MYRLACVLRSGGQYYIDDALRLALNLEDNRFLDRRRGGLLVFTDIQGIWDHNGLLEFVPLRFDWPGWWSKMEVFNPMVNGKDILYFDLDTMIVRPMPELFDAFTLSPKPRMLTDFYYPGRVQSSMFFVPHWLKGVVWKRWMTNPQGWMVQHEEGGDQEFLDHFMWSRWQDEFPQRIASFKVTLQENRHVPWPVSVVIFHGQPKPRDIGWDLRQG